jgi:hypothetical protein
MQNIVLFQAEPKFMFSKIASITLPIFALALVGFLYGRQTRRSFFDTSVNASTGTRTWLFNFICLHTARSLQLPAGRQISG